MRAFKVGCTNVHEQERSSQITDALILLERYNRESEELLSQIVAGGEN